VNIEADGELSVVGGEIDMRGQLKSGQRPILEMMLHEQRCKHCKYARYDQCNDKRKGVKIGRSKQTFRLTYRLQRPSDAETAMTLAEREEPAFLFISTLNKPKHGLLSSPIIERIPKAVVQRMKEAEKEISNVFALIGSSGGSSSPTVDRVSAMRDALRAEKEKKELVENEKKKISSSKLPPTLTNLPSGGSSDAPHSHRANIPKELVVNRSAADIKAQRELRDLSLDMRIKALEEKVPSKSRMNRKIPNEKKKTQTPPPNSALQKLFTAPQTSSYDQRLKSILSALGPPPIDRAKKPSVKAASSVAGDSSTISDPSLTTSSFDDFSQSSVSFFSTGDDFSDDDDATINDFDDDTTINDFDDEKQ